MDIHGNMPYDWKKFILAKLLPIRSATYCIGTVMLLLYLWYFICDDDADDYDDSGKAAWVARIIEEEEGALAPHLFPYKAIFLMWNRSAREFERYYDRITLNMHACGTLVVIRTRREEEIRGESNDHYYYYYYYYWHLARKMGSTWLKWS